MKTARCASIQSTCVQEQQGKATTARQLTRATVLVQLHSVVLGRQRLDISSPWWKRERDNNNMR